MSSLRVALGAATALALTLLTAWGSRVPVTFAQDDEALLRLSWRMEGITTEACRTLSDEELARLPVHMRNPRACIGVIAAYELRVRAGDALLVQDTVRPPGARGDRPLNVLQEFPLAPGEHAVSVEFRALLPEGAEAPEDGIAELAWEGRLHLEPLDVALVTLDLSGTRLELRESPR